MKTTTQNQKSESATVAVEHHEKPFLKSFYSFKKSDVGPANQLNTNIYHKHFPETRTTGEAATIQKNLLTEYF